MNLAIRYCTCRIKEITYDIHQYVLLVRSTVYSNTVSLLGLDKRESLFYVGKYCTCIQLQEQVKDRDTWRLAETSTVHTYRIKEITYDMHQDVLRSTVYSNTVPFRSLLGLFNRYKRITLLSRQVHRCSYKRK